MVRRKRSPTSPAETGVIRKSGRGRLHIALGYPNQYPVGMSSLGFQTIYGLMNGLDGVGCERFFLSEGAGPVRTVESGTPLSAFDIVAFSISFENDYPNLVRLLLNAGLPLPASERGSPHPLVMAGGAACFLNPEPIAPFLDCIIVGEAEAVLPDFLDKYSPTADRRRQLRLLASALPGVYVPQCYRIDYQKDGTLSGITATADVPDRVERVWPSDLDPIATRTVVMGGETAFSADALVEVSRGCPHGCRFCSAGYIYRPPRFRSAKQLVRQIRNDLPDAGRVGLVGAAVSDLPDLENLCAHLEGDRVLLSFSSLRADALTEGVIAALRANGTKTATIAPEAGSERLRKVINKGLTDDQIVDASSRLVEGGIPNLKLYFMVGLPTETDADMDAIVQMVDRVRKAFVDASRPRGRIGTLTVSVNPFVPKPFTPFQWAPMATSKVLQNRIRFLRKAAGPVPNLRFQSESVKSAAVQALLSRGDRRLSRLFPIHWASGARWPSTLKKAQVDLAFYLERERGKDELLPWDIIDNRVTKTFLWKEYRRALLGKTTAPCPIHGCRVCGVCQ